MPLFTALPDWLNLAQILGFVAFGVEMVSFSIKNDRRYIWGRAVGSFAWMLHYGFLSAQVALLIVAVDVTRYLFANSIRARPTFIWPAVVGYSALYILLGLWFQERPIDLLPAFFCIVTCLCTFVLRGMRMRIGFMAVLSVWLYYNLMIGSIGGAMNDAVLMALNAVTILRLWREKQVTEKPQGP